MSLVHALDQNLRLHTTYGERTYNLQAFVDGVGDGVTDTDDALLKATAAVMETGGRIYVPAGRYPISSNAIGSMQGVHVFGDGGGYPNGTLFEWRGSTDASYDASNPQPALNLEGCWGCTFERFGVLVPSGYRAAEGIRLTTQTGASYVSTRNVFREVGVSGVLDNVETCVRIGGVAGGVSGAVDANNDFHAFYNCNFGNYGNRGVYLEDTQVYAVQFNGCMFQPFGIQTSATGSITSGSTTLTHNAGFTAKDVGKVIEVAGAGAAGVHLRSRISSITNSTHCVLANAASTTVGPAATIYFGAQTGIYCRYSSFSAYGGGAGGHLSEDYFIGGGQAGPCLIEGAINEGSRRLLATDGPSGGTDKQVTLRNIRFAADAVVTAGPANLDGTSGNTPYIIDWVLGGGLKVEKCYLGDPDSSPPLKMLIGVTDGSPWDERFLATFEDNVIASSFGSSAIWVTGQPLFLGRNKLTGSGSVEGADNLGNEPLSFPRNGSSVSGAQTVSFGQRPGRKMTLSGAVTLTLANLFRGRDSMVRLWVAHDSGGPYAITWPAGTKTLGDVGASGASKTDLYEISYDGTNYWRRGWLGGA